MLLEKLYQSVTDRIRPEDVAENILLLLEGKLSQKERNKLQKAAQGTLKRNLWGYTSMSQTFAKPSGAKKQVSKAVELFKLSAVSKQTYEDSLALEAFITSTSGLIHKQYGQSHFVEDRLNKLERKANGIELSKRQYNKRFRLLKRLERKQGTLLREIRKGEFSKVAKHGLAHHLTFEAFAQDENTACFIAYYIARCNLRSEFTIFGQQSSYDEIADMLFDRLLEEEKQTLPFFQKSKELKPKVTTNWWAIAQVYPNARVLSYLSEEQKGMLLGRWTSVLEELSCLLKEVWENSRINKATMVVKKGDDSSTWNALAGAWNKARDSWMNLVFSLGMEAILEEICVGKVLRLMAADVVAWHFRSGGKLDANTIVWNELPLPWQVFSGKATCTKSMVERACKKSNVDPQKSGWIAPHTHGVVAFKPTPELVHGVSISNPFLAKVLKRHHYFSGKQAVKLLKPDDN
ncbi:hypothetical protein GXP67_16105 [Rhodocytophaga rosea]|uniref:Uncharacterized protein n=1 Tax=Rhodocytophaga rosea TaxID=2704465 RepID=A0A6C0GK46_9BACT|nr:hypothetical protein [Rhodocytophaga rosea]QHT68053.1 hypothetical protein GXP67_16105 [Rhodocytophaga rosea]